MQQLMKSGILIISFLFTLAVGASEGPSGQMDVPVTGMTCGSCARTIEGHFGKQTDVEAASVDLEKKLLHLKFKPGKSLSQAQISEQLESLGYHADFTAKK